MSDEAVEKKPPRLKILISAYACDPTLGSEPGMGGNWVINLAQYHDIWVITEEERYAPALRSYLETRPDIKANVHVIGIPRQRYGEKLWSHFYYFTYRLWQQNAYLKALELTNQIKFDLVHQLNMIGYREPGYLWKLSLPFVWGPIGGHAQMPWRFLASLGVKGAIHYGVRNILNWMQMRLSFRVRRAMKQASVLVAATPDDQKCIEKIHNRQAKLINEQGASPLAHMKKPKTWDGKRPLRLVWCGRFLALKALPIGLQALSWVIQKIPMELHIIGSGICEKKWKELAQQLGLSEFCRWHGYKPHDEALSLMQECDVMLFTSLQEGTPAVVMEAIQSGLPVICHDICGFGSVINVSCGIKIPAVTPEQSIKGFADALNCLYLQPNLLEKLSFGAIQQANRLTWANKVNEINMIYSDVMKK